MCDRITDLTWTFTQAGSHLTGYDVIVYYLSLDRPILLESSPATFLLLKPPLPQDHCCQDRRDGP